MADEQYEVAKTEQELGAVVTGASVREAEATLPEAQARLEEAKSAGNTPSEQVAN